VRRPSAARRLAKGALGTLGLYGLAARARRWPYRNVRSLRFEVEGRTVEFGTGDPLSHWWFFPRYARGRLHEPRETRLIVRALAGARAFADVGANLGWYTCVAAAHLPEGTVHAFEMDAGNFAALEANVKRNGFTNVVARHAAVSDRAGTAKYRRPPADAHGALFKLDAGAGGAGELVSVETVALDDYFADRVPPDVVKLDVEGAELFVLRGMRRLLESHAPRLFLEIHPGGLASFGHSPAEVADFLHARGYALEDLDTGAPLGDPRALRFNTAVQARRSSSIA